jgi:hypothetical protein
LDVGNPYPAPIIPNATASNMLVWNRSFHFRSLNRTMEEAFVWVAGHEAFHWLRHSRQITGAN